MASEAAELSRQLARRALDVCAHYLSKGQREGRYWTAGDVSNAAGRSLYVRLCGPDYGHGAAGHWADAATGEHGDLLDLIRLACGLSSLPEALDEARRFLALPVVENTAERPIGSARVPAAEAARRLFQAARPIRGTLAERYLAARGLVGLGPVSLRFHPRAYYRPSRDAGPEARPALLAAVTNLDGEIVGVQRTWLEPPGRKANVPKPRRALGDLLGHGVRIGRADDAIAAGEGLETVLSLVAALPHLPVVAALSASHLAALTLPRSVRRLYVVRDNDPAGARAATRLRERLGGDVEVLDLLPARGDFNDDLMAQGASGVLAHLRPQMWAEDLARFA